MPQLFQAIEIDGAAYWNGGYSGNPSIMPLVLECASHDTILVPINPVERPGTPRSAREVLDSPYRQGYFPLVTVRSAELIVLTRSIVTVI